MNLRPVKWLALISLLPLGCVYSHYPPTTTTYTTTSEVAPTSTREAVRVYPDTTTRANVPPEEWATAHAIRDLIASDPYVKGAARNVDVEVIRGAVILRGTVVSEYDRQELAARIARQPGVVSVDNRLVVSVP